MHLCIPLRRRISKVAIPGHEIREAQPQCRLTKSKAIGTDLPHACSWQHSLAASPHRPLVRHAQTHLHRPNLRQLPDAKPIRS